MVSYERGTPVRGILETPLLSALPSGVCGLGGCRSELYLPGGFLSFRKIGILRNELVMMCGEVVTPCGKLVSRPEAHPCSAASRDGPRRKQFLMSEVPLYLTACVFGSVRAQQSETAIETFQAGKVDPQPSTRNPKPETRNPSCDPRTKHRVD